MSSDHVDNLNDISWKEPCFFSSYMNTFTRESSVRGNDEAMFVFFPIYSYTFNLERIVFRSNASIIVISFPFRCLLKQF